MENNTKEFKLYSMFKQRPIGKDNIGPIDYIRSGNCNGKR